MSRKVFVAGASGVIGKALLKLLVAADYSVYGATRRAEKVKDIEATGATAVVVDVYDAERLNEELVRIQPWAVIHQLTDLPHGLSPELMAKAVENNGLSVRRQAFYFQSLACQGQQMATFRQEAL